MIRQPQQSSAAPWVIGIVVACAVVLAVLVWAATQGGDNESKQLLREHDALMKKTSAFLEKRERQMAELKRTREKEGPEAAAAYWRMIQEENRKDEEREKLADEVAKRLKDK